MGQQVLLFLVALEHHQFQVVQGSRDFQVDPSDHPHHQSPESHRSRVDLGNLWHPISPDFQKHLDSPSPLRPLDDLSPHPDQDDPLSHQDQTGQEVLKAQVLPVFLCLRLDRGCQGNLVNHILQLVPPARVGPERPPAPRAGGLARAVH